MSGDEALQVGTEAILHPYRVVVLSDLHFGSDHHFAQMGSAPGRNSLADAVMAAVTQRLSGVTIDAVVLAGDFFSRDAGNELGLADAGVRELMKVLAPRLAVAVPGNHDLTWSNPYRERPLLYYDYLVRSVGLGDFVSGELPVVRTLEDANGSLRPLAFVLLDSCRVESDEMAGIGFFGADQQQAFGQRLSAAGVTPETHHLLVVCHHHVLPVWARENVPDGPDPRRGPAPRVSYTVDGLAMMRQAAGRGARLVIHGHQHLPAVVSYKNHFWGQREVTVIATGSCGVHNERRQFFLIELWDTVSTITSFARDPDDPDVFALDLERPVVTIE